MLMDNDIHNSTQAYLDLYKDTGRVDTSCLHFFRAKVMENDSLAGFVAITGGRIINCELFGSSSLCFASFESMVKGYLRSITKNDSQPDVSNTEVKEFLDKFMQTEEQQKKYLALHGRLYLKNGLPLHLIAYND